MLLIKLNKQINVYDTEMQFTVLVKGRISSVQILILVYCQQRNST